MKTVAEKKNALLLRVYPQQTKNTVERRTADRERKEVARPNGIGRLIRFHWQIFRRCELYSSFERESSSIHRSVLSREPFGGDIC